MLHYQTINALLRESLKTLMDSPIFNSFRLVGGTALSLQRGHRISVDIDLFSDVPYGEIDFKIIDRFIESSFVNCSHFSDPSPAFGKSYSVGVNSNETIKLDIYYTDSFIQEPLVVDGIRMATTEEILAMKIDVIQRGGRKKDFWDLHELLSYPIKDMLSLHEQRYPYGHDRDLIVHKLTDFTLAEDDLEPICLKGKFWAFIKEDIEAVVEKYKNDEL